MTLALTFRKEVMSMEENRLQFEAEIMDLFMKLMAKNMARARSRAIRRGLESRKKRLALENAY